MGGLRLWRQGEGTGSRKGGTGRTGPSEVNLPVDAQAELHLTRSVDLTAVVRIVGADHAEIGRIADVQVRIAQLCVIEQIRELEHQGRTDSPFLPDADVLGHRSVQIPRR